MRTYADTWIKGNDETAIKEFCREYDNILGPAFYEGGWYACVRASERIVIPKTFCGIAREEGSAVLGVWA